MKQASHAVPSEVLLAAVGQILEAAGERHSIVIVGGACMNLLNIVSRATDDVDIIAAGDSGPGSVHFNDLLALSPSPDELSTAALWVLTQDAAPEFGSLIDDVMTHALSAR